MPINIVKRDDPLVIETIIMAIYGQPGAGKSSLGFTAKDPLLLDFDGGAHRSAFRKDTVRIGDWQDVINMTEADLKAYQTVCVDTAGRCLDALTADLIRENPKLAQRSGALTLQGYGELKAAFAGWLKTLRSYGKDIVLIAHDKEDKSRDDLIVRPDIQGGSYGEIFKASDAVAYLHIVNRQRVLEFSPSDEWVGKNPAGFDPLSVPDFNKVPNYLASVIQSIKNVMNEMSEEQKATVDKVEDYRARITKAKTAKSMNAILKLVNDEPEENIVRQVKRLMKDRVDELGLDFDKEKEQFVKTPAKEKA